MFRENFPRKNLLPGDQLPDDIQQQLEAWNCRNFDVVEYNKYKSLVRDDPYRGNIVQNETFLGRKIFYTKIDNSPSVYGKLINIGAALIMPFYFLAYPQLMFESVFSWVLDLVTEDIEFYLFKKSILTFWLDKMMIGSLGEEIDE